MKAKTQPEGKEEIRAWMDQPNECFWCWGLKTEKRMRELVRACIDEGRAQDPWDDWEGTIDTCKTEHCMAYTGDCTDPRDWRCDEFYIDPYTPDHPRHYKAITRFAVTPEFSTI